MEGIFRVRAMRKAAGPEDLDRLAPLAPPRAWLILAVVALMTAAALSWGLLGRVRVTVQGTGVATTTAEPLVFVNLFDGHKVAPGMPVRLTASALELSGRVLQVADFPSGRAEIQHLVGNEVLADWLASRGPSLCVRVSVNGQLPPGTPFQAQVTVSERRPLAMLWGRR